jgi:hypothetical protein
MREGCSPGLARCPAYGLTDDGQLRAWYTWRAAGGPEIQLSESRATLSLERAEVLQMREPVVVERELTRQAGGVGMRVEEFIHEFHKRADVGGAARGRAQTPVPAPVAPDDGAPDEPHSGGRESCGEWWGKNAADALTCG